MTQPAAARSNAIAKAEQFVRSRIWTLEDATVDELGQLYLDSYRRLLNDLNLVWNRYGTGETWSAADTAYRQRTDALLTQIGREIARLTDETTALTFDQAVRGYRGAYYGGAWIVEQGYRTDINLPVLPVEAVRAAILLPYEGSTFVDRFRDARAEFERKVQQAIVSSQIEGDTIYRAQKRLADALGISIDKRNPANKGLFARTEMIARTEILRSSNQGSLAIYEANDDVLAGWVWTLTNDERTCEICIAKNDHDRVYEFGEIEPPPNGSHPHCRCTPTPQLKNQELERKIVGKQQSYAEWASANGVGMNDGRVLAAPGARPPKAVTN